MGSNVRRMLGFQLERWIQRGVLHQLLVMAGLVAGVAAVGGLVAWAFTPAFDDPGHAIWWAFLRLTDPGYLGDDEGALLRVVSTVVTVLGYVLFMGSLIAIMTQWFALTVRRLESGLTPIDMRNHVVVLGWTNRTPELVAELLSSRGRLRRFLAQHQAGKLRIVILTDDDVAGRRHGLRDHLGPLWREDQIIMRMGSSLQPTHLERLDLARAAAVIVPGSDFELGGAELTDTRIVKTLLTIRQLTGGLPRDARPDVVAEVFDTYTVATARSTLGDQLEVVASDRIVSRLFSQSVLHRGVSRVLISLLSHREGDSLFLRTLPELAGRDPRTTPELFPRAVFLGVVRTAGRERHTLFDPREPLELLPDDLLVFVASCYDDCAPATDVAPEPWAAPSQAPTRRASDRRLDRVLIFGWSHKVPALVQELADARSDGVEITIMSRLSLADRETDLGRLGDERDRIRIRHVEGDYAIERHLVAVDPGSFDQILFLASGGMQSSEEADARTVLGYVLLRSLLADAPAPPGLIVELLDPDNAHLFDGPQETVLVTPRLLSLMLAHVALRPELNAVFDALFGARGAEFDLAPPSTFGLEGAEHRFADIQRLALAHGCLAVGWATPSSGQPELVLNPPRERTVRLGPEARLVVLAVDDG